MRILHVIPFFTPEMGGSAQVAYQMARHLGERGHDVTVVASDYGIRKSSFAPGPFEVVLLPARLARWGLYVTPALPRWITRNVGRFEIIHMHTVRTFQNAVVSGAVARRRLPYILSAHGTLPIIMERKAAKHVYDRLFGKRLLHGAARLVAVSPLEAAQYVEAGIAPARIAQVPNGLDLREFEDFPAQGTVRRRLNLPEDAELILFLGRLHPIKGVDVLIDAFARMQGDGGDPRLMIAGPDDGALAGLRDQVRDLGLQERVSFAGPLYGAEKLAAYADAGVVVAPGAYEIFGLVPFEALMCGTPVVVSDDCGAGALIRAAQAGATVPYGDCKALAAALREALAGRDGIAEQVARGQAYIRCHIDWQANAETLISLYEAVLQSSPTLRES
jgi:glycosyltransferase involved in cell wall biosynthesis